MGVTGCLWSCWEKCIVREIRQWLWLYLRARRWCHSNVPMNLWAAWNSDGQPISQDWPFKETQSKSKARSCIPCPTNSTHELCIQISQQTSATQWTTATWGNDVRVTGIDVCLIWNWHIICGAHMVCWIWTVWNHTEAIWQIREAGDDVKWRYKDGRCRAWCWSRSTCLTLDCLNHLNLSCQRSWFWMAW